MIILRLDRVMADRKMSLNELSEKVGIANVNLSKIKTGKISAIRFSTLDAISSSIGRIERQPTKNRRSAAARDVFADTGGISGKIYGNFRQPPRGRPSRGRAKRTAKVSENFRRPSGSGGR